MIGTTIGARFHIVGRIGDGWLFSVYRARDRVTGQLVAVKVVRPAFTIIRSFATELRRAMEGAVGISYPSLVRYIAVGEAGAEQSLFLACELVAGHDLSQLLQRRLPMAVSQALQLLAQIADGVAHLHRAGLVHSDLRPHNILVTSRGEVKTGDYALSSAYLTLRTAETEWMERAAPYLAPERFQSDEATAKSDIYALGVLLYQMVTGRLPFEASSVSETSHLHLTAPVPLASSLNPSVPFSVDAIILRAMAKDPQQRFDSADEFRSALQEALAMIEGGAISSLIPDVEEASRMPTSPELAESEEAISLWQRLTQSVTGLMLGALSFLVIAILLLYYALIGTAPKEVIVPDVSGLSLIQAQKELAERGLNLSVRWEFSKEVTPKHVIRVEDPEPGRKVREGREVLVVASRGATKTMVPDVTGLRVSDALTALKNAKLRVGDRVDTYSETIQAGTVVGQQPPPGVDVPEGTPVGLIVSKGTPPPQPEIDWQSLPTDAKAARIFIVVGGTKIRQEVQIRIIDAQGKRDVYRAIHSPGDRIVRTVVGRGIVKVQVLINGQVVGEGEL